MLYFWLTICILLSFIIIAILYFVIWINVYKTDHDNRSTLQQQTLVNTRRLAFKLSLYVVVYSIQYGGVAVEGMLVSTTDMPKIVRIISIVGSMSGGIINGIVYEKLRRSQIYFAWRHITTRSLALCVVLCSHCHFVLFFYHCVVCPSSVY